MDKENPDNVTNSFQIYVEIASDVCYTNDGGERAPRKKWPRLLLFGKRSDYVWIHPSAACC